MESVEKQGLLEIMTRIAPGGASGEHESDDEFEFIKNFLPLPDYRRVLETDTLLILGGRGTGKTQLFRLLAKPLGREALATQIGARALKFLDRTIWVSGFGRANKHEKKYPAPENILQTLKDGDMLGWRSFWMALILSAIFQQDEFCNQNWSRQIPEDLREKLTKNLRRIGLWFNDVRNNLEVANELLDDLDDYLIQTDKWLFITYDELDRLVPYEHLATPIRELLAFWLDRWRRWERIRPKVFLRSDLFKEEFLGFPDASKLQSHQVRLEWTTPWLYQLVVKRLANVDEAMKEYLDILPDLIVGRDHLLGWTPNRDEKLYEKLMEVMVGEHMGSSPKRGKTYRWIPNHLQDADGRIAPRSFLNIFAIAAEQSLLRSDSLQGERLLSPTDLQGALMKTSEYRIRELAHEEYPWLQALKKSLSGEEVPMPQINFLDRLLRTKWDEKNPPPVTEPDQILEYLSRLGIVEIRGDSRINMPEIYHYGFGLKRRGGIKRPKNTN